MRFLANSRPTGDTTRQHLADWVAEHGVDSEAWDLIRHRVVTNWAFKVGDEPGIVLFLDVDTEEEAAEHVNALPIAQHGLLTFEIDPLSAIAKF